MYDLWQSFIARAVRTFSKVDYKISPLFLIVNNKYRKKNIVKNKVLFFNISICATMNYSVIIINNSSNRIKNILLFKKKYVLLRSLLIK